MTRDEYKKTMDEICAQRDALNIRESEAEDAYINANATFKMGEPAIHMPAWGKPKPLYIGIATIHGDSRIVYEDNHALTKQGKPHGAKYAQYFADQGDLRRPTPEELRDIFKIEPKEPQ